MTAMLKLWDEYVATNNVVLPSRTTFEGLKKVLPQRFPDDTNVGYPPLLYKKQYVPPADMMQEQTK